MLPERIECTMNIIISKVEDDLFTGEIQVQVRRPVFNSSYNTVLFNSGIMILFLPIQNLKFLNSMRIQSHPISQPFFRTMPILLSVMTWILIPPG